MSYHTLPALPGLWPLLLQPLHLVCISGSSAILGQRLIGLIHEWDKKTEEELTYFFMTLKVRANKSQIGQYSVEGFPYLVRTRFPTFLGLYWIVRSSVYYVDIPILIQYLVVCALTLITGLWVVYWPERRRQGTDSCWWYLHLKSRGHTGASGGINSWSYTTFCSDPELFTGGKRA